MAVKVWRLPFPPLFFLLQKRVALVLWQKSLCFCFSSTFQTNDRPWNAHQSRREKFRFFVAEFSHISALGSSIVQNCVVLVYRVKSIGVSVFTKRSLNFSNKFKIISTSFNEMIKNERKTCYRN